jgi:hypothetical protein
MLSRISVVLTVLLAIVPSILTTHANPVLYPLISMPYEYIYANITVTNNDAYAKVNGTYPFVNDGYQNVSMSYPLPQNSTNVSVEVSENMPSWRYSDVNYSTVFGDLPVINWTIDPAPDKFAVEVDYEHAVPIIDKNFTYFYAMGTWKNLKGFYAKQTTAYVTVDISMESIGETETLEVHAYQILLDSTTQEWIWEPQNYTMSRINNTFRVKVTVTSAMFHPIKGDFLLTFEKAGIPESLPVDLNKDGVVNTLDLTIVAAAFRSKPGDKNWNAGADIDKNGQVNIIDISMVAKDYGKTA